MHEKRDDYEPIIATRRSRERLHEDGQPLWRLVLGLCGGLAVVGLLAWWLMGRSPSEDASTPIQSESSLPETSVEQAPLPPARDSKTDADITHAPAGPAPAVPATSAEPATGGQQAATPENIPDVVPDNVVQEPVPPAPVPSPAPISLRFMSPDTQVRVELRAPSDSSPPLTGKVGDVITVPPGTYRAVISGAQLETFEQQVTLDGEGSLEYTVELCAERQGERESRAGHIVEERACAGTAQCESMFMILSEYADQLVKDPAFRAQQCAKWRPAAAPEGRWTLDTKCDGATLATTCRIEIAEGVCTFAEPPRSVRGSSCPRGELKATG